MNGRLYDPVVGRFLEPDPVVQNAASTQNLNRYSYALNNPLKYIDPSGNSMKQCMEEYYEQHGDSYWYRGDYYSPDGNGNYTGMFSGMAPTSGHSSAVAPGVGENGSGANGVYYDYYTRTYRTTGLGNPGMSWVNAYYTSIYPHAEPVSALIFTGPTWNRYENLRGIHYADGSTWYSGEGYSNGVAQSDMKKGSWLSDLWNNSAIGKIIPDVIYINQGNTYTFVGGGGLNTGYAFVIKGKDAGHLYSTTTLTGKSGAHGSVGINIGYSSYVGDSRNFDFDVSFGGNGTRGFDTDATIIGIGGNVSPLDNSGGLLYSYDAGFGWGVGSSVNIGSITYVHRIW